MTLPRSLREEIITHALAEQPHECCGLFAGAQEVVQRYIPLVNELASPVAYSAEPGSLFRAFKSMRAAGQELIAVVHSHPRTAAVPSMRDLKEWHYPDTVMLIVSLEAEPVIMAWRIVNGKILNCSIIDTE